MINFIYRKFDIIDSTNDYVVREVEKFKLTKDAVVLSKCQTNGHGSKGRSFISSKNVGIYFSLLHFYSSNKEIEFITQKAAVAVYNTFLKIFNIELQIKWVNDLHLMNKKVSGILCKNLIKNKAVIIGIGINLFENKNIDESIKSIAGSIFRDKTDLLNKLDENLNISKTSYIYKNIKKNFKSINTDQIDIDDNILWEPDQIVFEIVKNIYELIHCEGLPEVYIKKNIIKDKKIYEDYNLEC